MLGSCFVIGHPHPALSVPAALPLNAHFSQPREASKALGGIFVTVADVPASRNNSQTCIFMNLTVQNVLLCT